MTEKGNDTRIMGQQYMNVGLKKARNGQNITRFGLDPTVLACRPYETVAI